MENALKDALAQRDWSEAERLATLGADESETDRLTLADVLRRQNKLEESLAEYRKISEGENWVAAQLGVALVEQTQGDYDAALAVLDALLARHPGVERAHSARALVFQKKGQFEEAIEVYHQALDIHFDKVANRIIQEQGISTADTELFQHVMFNELKRVPFTCTVYNQIGLCYLNLNERDGARAYFKDAIKHIPAGYGFPEAAENLELLIPLKAPVANDLRAKLIRDYDLDLPIFGGSGSRQDPLVLNYEPNGMGGDLVRIEHDFIRAMGRALEFKVLELVGSEILTLDGRVLDRVRFEVSEIQGVEIKKLVRTWWFDVTAPWHQDLTLNPAEQLQ